MLVYQLLDSAAACVALCVVSLYHSRLYIAYISIVFISISPLSIDISNARSQTRLDNVCCCKTFGIEARVVCLLSAIFGFILNVLLVVCVFRWYPVLSTRYVLVP